ncbi:MAG: low molecular weight phosphatase family protein [Candidatus Microsaccharimonas sp.]
MKTLFVCQANVARSQAAMELFRQMGHEADSAGTKVDAPGKTLAERPSAKNVVQVMREEYGVDMINNVRTQITKELAQRYDQIVVMAEHETVPGWLLEDSRALFWKIDDPKGQDIAFVRRVVGEVREHVDSLIND